MLILSFLPPRLEVASLTVLVLVIGTVWILKEKLIQVNFHSAARPDR